MKNRTIRKRFESMEEARSYAESVDKALRRKAATIAEVGRIDWTKRTGPVKSTDDLMVWWYEVSFVTRSTKF